MRYLPGAVDRQAHSKHVESNENKPFEFVGEDIILPQEKKNEMPSALNVTL